LTEVKVFPPWTAVDFTTGPQWELELKEPGAFDLNKVVGLVCRARAARTCGDWCAG